MTELQIFRYDFTPSVVRELSAFAEIHMNDGRKDYNIAWEKWCEQHYSMVSDETKRLENTGYDGDVNDKLYKAGRYYFRKKSKSRAAQETESPPPKNKTKTYVTVQEETLSHMDEHIRSCMKENTLTPKVCYKKFIREYQHIILSEREHLTRNYEMSTNDIDIKVKKTYKNRYYIITRHKNGQK